MFNLTNFYVQTGATRSDIIDSVISFESKVGALPDLGSMTVKLTYPVLNVAGSPVTITKGMTIWPSYYQASPVGDNIPFAGVITDVKQRGEILTVTAESVIAPLMRSTFSGTYSSLTYVYAIFNAALAAFTPAAPFLISESYGIYRAVTGGSQVAVNVQLDDLAVTDVPIGALAQYFAELLPNTTLASNLSVVYPTYYTDPGTGKAAAYLSYTGYGNHPATAIVLSHDTGLISNVDWSDATDSVLNDVTVTIKEGTAYQVTNGASITAYGQRPTKIFRPMYYTDTTYAQKHADSMVNNLKDPKSRCVVDVDADYILGNWGTVNGVYTVTDGATGRSEEMVLRAFTLKYPSNIATCEFDNAALNLSNYGVRLDNRVSSIEANTNQALNPTSSPTFVDTHLAGRVAFDGTTAKLLADATTARVEVRNHDDNAYGELRALNIRATGSYIPTVDDASDFGSSSYALRTMYAKTALYMNGTQFMDSSRNLSNILSLVITNTDNCTMAANSNGTLKVSNAFGYVSIGPASTSGSHFLTDRANFYFNKHVVLYDTNTYDFGSTSYNARSIYLGTSIIMGGSVAMDASRNLTNIGSVGCTQLNSGISTQGLVYADGSAPAQMGLAGNLESFTNLAPYAVFKTYRIRTALNGTVRFRWTVTSSGMYSMSYMTINGIMVGTAINTGAGLNAYHDDTLAVNLVPGDIIEFWGYTTDGYYQTFKDFYLNYYVEANSDTLATAVTATPTRTYYYDAIASHNLISGNRPAVEAMAYASTTTQYENASYFEVSSASYVHAKSIRVYQNIRASNVVVRAHVNVFTGYAQIRKNGVPISAKLAMGSTSTTYTIPVYDLRPGDVISVYVRIGTANWFYFTATTDYLRICFDMVTTTAEAEGSASAYTNLPSVAPMVMFSAMSTAATSITSAGVTVPFVTITAPYFANCGDAYISTTGIFTTPVAGYYRLTTHCTLTTTAAATYFNVTFSIGGVTRSQFHYIKAATGAAATAGGSGTFYLAAGVACKVVAYATVTQSLSTASGDNEFSVELISS